MLSRGVARGRVDPSDGSHVSGDMFAPPREHEKGIEEQKYEPRRISCRCAQG